MRLFYDNTPEKKSTAQSSDKIEGIIEKVIYKNDENSYAVCEIELANGDYHTIEGYMPLVAEGDSVCVHGRWVMNAKYGKQFKVEQYERVLPKDVEDIQKYLSGGAIKGIGPVSAAKIVDKFGESTFDVMENHPEWLADIPGISKRKAKEIGEEYKKKSSMRDTMIFFRDYFGMTVIMRIYKRWGKDSIKTVRENPYILCDEINGIGFEKADKVARSLGIEGSSPQRVRSGIIYVLTYNANTNGHTLVPKNRLIELSAALLGVEPELCEDAIDVLEFKNKIAVERIGGRECVYLAKYRDAEHYIKDKLDMLEATCVKSSVDEAEKLIGRIEEKLGIKYDGMQKKAILHSLYGGVLVLTGGPGTGKTTVIKGIIELFSEMKRSYILAAPTGRAAKRMTEATGREAKTIHRMLETVFKGEKEQTFARDSDNPLDEDLVIVDEASMIDTLLMSSLLKAVKPGSRLILIGDRDQLPSVGAGNVLSEIIESERYRTVTLKKIFRQAGESLIVTNAHAINSGEDPELFSKSSDFFFVPREDEKAISDTVAALYVGRIPKKYGADPLSEIQVITPSHRGAAGTESLNIMLQRHLNPPSQKRREKKYREIVFREGDKVMQIKNNYDIVWSRDGEDGYGIFNGDIGVIISVLHDDEAMLIDFDGRITRYDFTMLDELEHAYAITVHKSQGSEYPYVIIPIYNCGDRLLTRNLLYTAVTRAQSMVILVGDASLVHRMVQNNRHVKRYTGLKQILSAEENKYEGIKGKRL